MDLNDVGGRLGNLGADVATEAQALFLVRLRHLLEKRYGGNSACEEAQQLLLDRAIYSTFCDCLELGVSDQARSLLNELRNS
jgi:hypothetical protein